MQIAFKKIHLHNFFSFVDEELELSDLGYTIISGHNNVVEDFASSNGSGKTSIFNGLCWALTGETIQGITNNIENIFGNPDDCWVEVEFNVDNDNYVVRRIKTPYSNMKIYINGEDKSGKGIRESSKLLSQYLPELTPQLVSSVIILGQGMPNRFTNNKPAARKEILEVLTNSDYIIQGIKDKLEERMTSLKDQLRTKEDEKLVSDTQIKVYEDRLNKINKSIEECKSLSAEGPVDDKICNNKSRLVEIDKRLSDIESLGSYNTENIDKNQNDLNEFISRRPSDLAELTKDVNAKISCFTDDLSILDYQISFTKSEIKRLEAITDVCPTCGQKLPDVHKIDTTELHKDLEAKEAERTIKKSDLSTAKNEKADIEKEFDRCGKLYTSELNTRIREYKDKNKALNAEQADLLIEKSELTSEIHKLETLYSTITNLTNDKAEVIKNLEEYYTNNKSLTDEISDINSHIPVVQNLITLAKREFRGIILQNIISYLDNKMKTYSKIVFETDLISFVLEDNYINIYYGNKPYENLSGGEKQKIDIIVQIALRELLSNQLGVHSNILVVDEIFDNLDTKGCRKVLELLSKLEDLSSIFIITHHKESLEIACDTEIEVIKNENSISSIKYV